LKKHIIAISLVVFNSCGIKTSVLRNGITRVAINEKVYKNKSKFKESILKEIDTLVIYEEYNRVSYTGLQSHIVNMVARKNDYHNSFYSVYRFYNNGCFNVFILNKENKLLKKELFDPNYAGYRGVYYHEKKQIKGDRITQVSGIGTMGKITETFEFKGDTLFIRRKNKWNYIYIKRKIPAELLNREAKW